MAVAVEESEAIVRRFFEEIWNRANLAAVDSLFALHYVDHSPGPTQERGRASIKKYIAMLHTALPDLHVTVEDVFTSGDRVAARLTFRGTHRGNLLGLAPTGQAVTWTGIDIYRIAEGRIAEGWAERDRLGMRQQIPAQRAVQGFLGRARSRIWSRRQLLSTQVQVYRALQPAARTWREQLSLLRFVLARLAVGDAGRREATLHLDGATYRLGLGTAEIYTLTEHYRDRLYDRAPDFIPRPGWTCLDVGANIGIVAVQQARRGARVFAFEPNPDCYRRLTANVAANRLSRRISSFNDAVGAAPGTGVMQVPRGLTTFGSVTPLDDAATATAAAPSSAIQITSLDHIMPTLDIARVDLLKIDTEGAELEVLRGARHTLGMVERVVVEYHSQQLLQQIEAMLNSHGFARVLRVDANPGRDAGLLFAKKAASAT